ncbi:MAG: hypothetical protein V1895_03705 [Parcubacteria group bacterium]
MSDELGLLGSQLALAMRFRAGGFDKNDEVVECQVTHDKVPIRELFNQEGSVWVMRPDSVPGYVAIKAIAVSERKLMLETAPIDWEAFRTAISEANLPFVCDGETGKVSMSMDRENRRFKPVLYISKPMQPPKPSEDGERLLPRVLWKFYIDENTPRQRQLVLQLADTAGEQDTFIELPGTVASSTIAEASSMRPEIRLDMRLMQTLALEQVPIMCLGMELKPELQLKQELRGVMLMQNARRLTRMKSADAYAYVQDVGRALGEDMAYRLLVYAVAGKVKEHAPGLTWKQARSIARRETDRALQHGTSPA